MTMNRSLLLTGLALLLGALPLAAFAQPVADASSATPAVSAASDDSAEAPITITHPNMRPPDRRGLNVFEPPKSDADRLGSGEPRLRVGAGFAQQFQALDHSNTALARWVPNTATPAPDDSVNLNALADIGAGFNLASANLTLDALLTDGVHVNLVTYLSSRHHQEAWVKGGYIQVDAMRFLGSSTIDEIMNYATLKVGHYEVNYGDAHFRRTDNGNAFYNPFVGNYIMDAFTTEIGGELLLRHAGFLGMIGVTGGEINGNVTAPEGRSWALITKLGVDRQVTPDLRLRLTGSMYHNGNAARNTLYGGDRAGSRYFYVLENTQATTSAQFTSGLINPGFTEEITAFQLNPFVKFHGLELFGVLERASGRSLLETEDVGRAWTQYAVDAVFRFLPQEQAFVGVRYNNVSGPLTGPTVNGAITAAGPDISIDRWEIGAGWFATRNILLKGEYVLQNYRDFPDADIRNGGEFSGFMVEGVVAF
jgi:hypothetical protein